MSEGRLTHLDAVRIAEADEIINLVVHPALLPDLVRWLDQRGLDLGRVPSHEDEDADAMPHYITTPRFREDDVDD